MKRHRGQKRRSQAAARSADHAHTRADGLHSGGGAYRRRTATGGGRRRTRNGRCSECGRRAVLAQVGGLWMCEACAEDYPLQ